MKSKLYQLLFMGIFFIIFSFFHFGEYNTFYKQNEATISWNKQVASQTKDFTIDDIQTLSGTSIFWTPNMQFRSQLLKSITSCDTRVYLETYILTDREIQEALIQANNNCEIKVLLEKNPYKAYNLNNKAFDKLKDAWVNVVWNNADNYALNHSKLLIIDDTIILSTGNYSYSTFTKNRDFFIFSRDNDLKQTIVSTFISDFEGKKQHFFHNNFLTSPNNSRDKIEKLINSSEKNIEMYFPYTGDDSLKKLLIQKAHSGIEIKLLVDKKADTSKNNELQELSNVGIDVRIFNGSLHAKAILVDKKYLYLGSINFSYYSLDKNREMWVLLKNIKNIENFSQIFQQDFIWAKKSNFLEN